MFLVCTLLLMLNGILQVRGEGVKTASCALA